MRPPASSPSRLVIDRRPPVQPRLLLSPPQPSSSSPPPPSISSAPSISSPLSSSAGLDANLRKAILDDVCKRLTPTAIKIRADIEVTCFHYEGINAIRSALLKGAELAAPEVSPRSAPPPPRLARLAHPPLASSACGTAAMRPSYPPPLNARPPPPPPQHNEGRDLGMKVKLVAPPLYVMTCSAYDKARRADAAAPRCCNPLPRPAAAPRGLDLPAASCCSPARDSLPPRAPSLQPRAPALQPRAPTAQPVILPLHASRRTASSCSTTPSR